MDPELIARLLKEYEDQGGQDELAAEQKRLDHLYQMTKCPQCGGSCRKEYDGRTAFSDPNLMVAKALLRCVDCGCHFDPHTGLRLEQGNLGKIPHPHVLIRPSKE